MLQKVSLAISTMAGECRRSYTTIGSSELVLPLLMDACEQASKQASKQAIDGECVP